MPEPPYLTDDWLAYRDLALVYYPRGRMAHLMRDPNRSTSEPVCRSVPWWHSAVGTGTQDEWERARELPLCPVCRERTEPRNA